MDNTSVLVTKEQWDNIKSRELITFRCSYCLKIKERSKKLIQDNLRRSKTLYCSVGCSSNAKKLQTFEFVERSEIKHNFKYYYWLTLVSGIQNKVTIICIDHRNI